MLAGRSGRGRLGCLAAMVALVALVVAPAGAAAQEDGVFVDPDSPAGTEYAVPTESARQQGVPDPGDGAPEKDGAPAFGVGITSAEDAQGGRRGRETGARGDGRSGSRSESREQGAGSGSRGAAATLSKGTAGVSSGLLSALIALGVLLIGGAVALVFRAYRSTS